MSSGFSISTCLPASAQRTAMSRCVFAGVNTATASTLPSSRIVSILSQSGKGNLSPKLRRRASLGAKAWTTSTASARSIRPSACGVTAMPRPTIAMRVFVMSVVPFRIQAAPRSEPLDRRRRHMGDEHHDGEPAGREGLHCLKPACDEAGETQAPGEFPGIPQNRLCSLRPGTKLPACERRKENARASQDHRGGQGRRA